jgi:hypothetical protein
MPWHEGWLTHNNIATRELYSSSSSSSTSSGSSSSSQKQLVQVIQDTNSPEHRSTQSRYWRHVVLCKYTRNALQGVRRVRAAGIAVAITSALATCITRSTTTAHTVHRFIPSVPILAVVGVLAVLASAVAHRLERAFFTNFERVPVL